MQLKERPTHSSDEPQQFLFASNRHEDTQIDAPSPVPPKKVQKPWWQRKCAEEHHPRRRRIFTWWNFFAVIGIISVVLQVLRYAIIPLLVYLNVLAGGRL